MAERVIRLGPASLPHQRFHISRRAFLGAGAAALLAPRLLSAQGGGAAPRHIVLVTADTLRADHLPWHGYPRDTAPFLAGLASRSYTFTGATSSCAHTNPAHLSIFTGLHPPQHKLHTNIEDQYSTDLKLLPEHLRAAGYKTAAFGSVIWLDIFNRGFDHFDTYDKEWTQEAGEVRYRPADETVQRALDWLEGQDPAEKTFVWLHLFDPHRPYIQRDAYNARLDWQSEDTRREMTRHWTDQQKKRVKTWNGDLEALCAAQNGYDAEIMFLDTQLERLYGFAKERGYHDNALWIFTADHGEGMGSHFYTDHGMTLYREQIHVPLFFHQPGKGGNPVMAAGPVEHVDIVPTLAELVGLPQPLQPATLPGRSLVPCFTGEAPPRLAFAQRQHRYPTGFSKDWEEDPVYALFNDRYKYIVHTHGQDEFFDLRADPHELVNLAGQDTYLRHYFAQEARRVFSALEASAGGVTAPHYDDEYIEHLKSLGYT